jgi:hypothetical protein
MDYAKLGFFAGRKPLTVVSFLIPKGLFLLD